MSSSSSNSLLFHRSLEKSYPTAVSGNGVYLQLSDGRLILDGSSGAAVSSVGHGNQEVIKGICDQAQKLSFAHSSFYTCDPAEELAELIIRSSEGAFSKALFLQSGSEAVESALKLARQYHVYRGQPERVNIIGRMNSYHGNTLGALAAGNNPSRRSVFAPLLGPAFHHLQRCFYDKDGQGFTEKEYEDSLIAEYEAMFQRLGHNTIAAVIVEPVVGATLGSVPATAGYLPRLVELCKSHGILTIFDEVMCGMGRTGTLHAWQGLGGVAPDLQTIGKGLGAGYQPLSAVLIGSSVYDVFQEHSKGSNAFVSGHTFQGHAMACAGALAVQKILIRDGLIEQCARLGEILQSRLSSELPPSWSQHGGSIRGRGLFRSVDFGEMKDAFGGPLAKEVASVAFELGAAVYLCSPLTDSVLLCPPFIASEEEIKKLADILAQAVIKVLEGRN